jgi:cytochrome c551/c552
MSRYVGREKAINNNEQYDKLLEKRGVRKVVQYRTPENIHTTDEEKAKIDCHQVVWRVGMSYQYLASQYYGDFRQWWVIAGFNNKPTENHVKPGDILRIPKDISEALKVVE